MGDCPICGGPLTKFGYSPQGRQRVRCKACGMTRTLPGDVNLDIEFLKMKIKRLEKRILKLEKGWVSRHFEE